MSNEITPKVRKQRLLALADYIEAHPKHFDMGVFAADRTKDGFRSYRTATSQVCDLEHLSCDSVGCIAGTAVGLWGNRKSDLHISEEAARVLGLSRGDASHLFYGVWSRKGIDDITAAEAASHLRSLAEAA